MMPQENGLSGLELDLNFKIVDVTKECLAPKQLTEKQFRRKIWIDEVVHRCTVADTAVECAQWYKEYKKTGNVMPYTFWIGQDGVICQTLPLMTIGWHAKSWSKEAVGIAVNHDCRKSPLPGIMYDALVTLETVLSICKGEIRIAFHDKLEKATNTPGKECPGNCLVYKDLKQSVKANMTTVGFSLLNHMITK